MVRTSQKFPDGTRGTISSSCGRHGAGEISAAERKQTAAGDPLDTAAQG